MMMSIVLVDTRPYSSFEYPNRCAKVESLVRLHDNSFVSCSALGAKRWTVNNNKEIVNLGSFGDSEVVCAAQKDNYTLITSTPMYLKEWNMKSYLCINIVRTLTKVNALTRTKSKQYIVCGLDNETVEVRRLGDLSIVSSFELPSKSTICELTDGSFVSGSIEDWLKQWDMHGTVLQTFDHSEVQKVIEVKNDIIVSGSSYDLKVWRVSTGECLHTFSQSSSFIVELEKLSEGLFCVVTTRSIKIWCSDMGDWIERIYVPARQITAMARLRDSIVVATGSPTSIVGNMWNTDLYMLQLKPKYYEPQTMTEMCCAVISANRGMYNVGELKRVLPEELFRRCFDNESDTPTVANMPVNELAQRKTKHRFLHRVLGWVTRNRYFNLKKKHK